MARPSSLLNRTRPGGPEQQLPQPVQAKRRPSRHHSASAAAVAHALLRRAAAPAQLAAFGRGASVLASAPATMQRRRSTSAPQESILQANNHTQFAFFQTEEASSLTHFRPWPVSIS